MLLHETVENSPFGDVLSERVLTELPTGSQGGDEMIDRLRALSPPLRYSMYVTGVLLALFVAVGVGATTAVVVGWQFGPVATSCGSTSPPCCSARGSACSTTWGRSASNLYVFNAAESTV